jgi:hypothetical protein
MHNAPFRVLDSPASVSLLLQRLEQVGLTKEKSSQEEGEPDPNHPICLRFNCRWLSEPVELLWQYSWWADGTASELRRISIRHAGSLYGEVDVESLPRQSLGRPLVELVIDAITSYCANLTGKSLRRPHRRRRGEETR